jgi:hypothetical protein
MSRRLSVFLFSVLICCVGVVPSVIAEDLSEKLVVAAEDITQIVTLDDGSSLVGRIVEVGDSAIKFVSDLGEMTIAIDKIKDVIIVDASNIKGGKYWYPNPNQTRMLFGPTGRMLKQGDGYFFDVLIFFPGVAYGLTDNITIGGGMSIFPGFDAEEQLYFITPKVGLNVMEDVDLAANLMLIRVPVDEDDVEDVTDLHPLTDTIEVEVAETVGLLYASGTYGSEHSYVTFGLGFGLVDEKIADKPAVALGFEHRFARRVSFVSENWIFPGLDDPVISGGIRFFGESIAVDLAAMTVFDNDVPLIPYIDFVWNF